jgi:ATP-dependent Clp endopeptidase proteolytic subunit ClpP
MNGIIRFYGEVDASSVYTFLREIDEIKRCKIPHVTLYITSPGGDCYDAFAIYDAIKDLSSSGVKVIAIVEGWAASAAAMILLQAADERYCRPSTRFLLHEVRRWAFAEEKASELQDEVKEINVITNMILEILSKKCNRSKEEVKKLIERREVWMSAEEALEWGLVDQIV